MSRLITLVFSIFGVVGASAFAAIVLLLRPKSAFARRLVAGVALFYLLSSTYAVPHALASVWNAGYGRFESHGTSGRTAIVLLGSGGNLVAGWESDFAFLTPVGASRVLETARIYKLFAPDAVVISSGGHVHPGDTSPTSSETMRGALVDLGVPAEHIVLESESRDTHDEAIIIAPMLRDLKTVNTVLVTSDVHMRRSIGTFLAAGVVATPSIAPDPGFFAERSWWMPSDLGLQFSADLVHEFVGLPYYWWRGWWRRT
jgi:uncharacterized SAM-binding protein YcdF (DUF218 family)